MKILIICLITTLTIIILAHIIPQIVIMFLCRKETNTTIKFILVLIVSFVIDILFFNLMQINSDINSAIISSPIYESVTELISEDNEQDTDSDDNTELSLCESIKKIFSKIIKLIIIPLNIFLIGISSLVDAMVYGVYYCKTSFKNGEIKLPNIGYTFIFDILSSFLLIITATLYKVYNLLTAIPTNGIIDISLHTML